MPKKMKTEDDLQSPWPKRYQTRPASFSVVSLPANNYRYQQLECKYYTLTCKKYNYIIFLVRMQ